MTTQLRIAIADDEARMRDYLWTSLDRLGHQVVAAAKTGKELVEQCREQKPDLIVTDIKMHDMDGIDAAHEIYKEKPIPVILVSAFHDDEYIQRAAQNHVLAYLVKPIKATDLEPAIAVAMQRFREFDEVSNEAASYKQALEDRKIIERAKGILMKRAGLDEPEAFRRLQKNASSKCMKLVEMARMIVTTEEVLETSLSE